MNWLQILQVILSVVPAGIQLTKQLIDLVVALENIFKTPTPATVGGAASLAVLSQEQQVALVKAIALALAKQGTDVV